MGRTSHNTIASKTIFSPAGKSYVLPAIFFVSISGIIRARNHKEVVILTQNRNEI